MRGAGFAQIYALLTVRARRPGPEQSKPPRRRRRAVRFNLENQANAFPMSSPPSVPNSYWGSDTFRKDSVGWSSSLKAPDRPRYEAAGPAPGNVLWCSDGWRYVGGGTSAMPSR